LATGATSKSVGVAVGVSDRALGVEGAAIETPVEPREEDMATNSEGGRGVCT
jgi:hypothetical protein